MKRIIFVALAVLLVVSADAAPTVNTFAGGETLVYSLIYFRMAGGTATLTAAASPSDPAKIRMTSVAQTSSSFSRFYRVRDSLESIVGRADFSTLYYRKMQDEGGKKKDEITLVDQAKGTFTRKGKTKPVPHPVYDPLSIIYYLRMQDLTPGRSYKLTVLADGKIYPVELEVKGRESIVTDAGRFDCVLVQPTGKGVGIFRDEDSDLSLWFSDDARHLPVRIRSDVKIGTITASLKQVR